ncbi:MAG: CoA transferase [Chloroflexi bacterium]|nr:CoA transferase [Chloroflexota bacterium]
MPTPMPLAGVRVLDLTHHAAGPFCTRLLGDYGADVIKVEPPGGDIARTLPPFYGDEPGPERSGLFMFLNTNKRSVVLDLKTEAGRAQLLELTRDADALVENFSPGTLERLGLGYEVLHAANPRLVVTSISNFGQDGPYRDYHGMDLTLYGLGGVMFASGERDHEPLKLAGRQTSYYSGMVAALATAVALHAAAQRGEGEHVDVSIFETATHSIDLRLARLMYYQYNGRYSSRPALASAVGSGTYPCADGWFMLGAGPARLDDVLRMIERAELLETPEWATLAARVQPERVDEFAALLLPWMLTHTKSDILQACMQHGVLGAPINTIADLLDDPNFVERRFFQQIDHPVTGPLTYPGYHFTLHRPGEPMPTRRRAPLLGEHTAEVLRSAGAAPDRALRTSGAAPARAPDARREPAQARAGLPLEGLRILDFTVVLAGPYATMQLADWGAEVIRIESLQHFAPSTRGQLARPPRELALALANGTSGLGYPDDDPGEHPWNRASHFNHHGRGKRSMTVDLSRPEGRSVFERLVAQADGLIENNLPPNIEKQGITWERLSQINQRLIMVRVPGFGVTGPYRTLRSMGHFMEAVAGHPAIRTYPDLSLEYIPLGVPSDAASGIGGAFAFMMGLRYREQTGHGLLIEQATAENFVPLIGEFVMDYGMNGRLWSQMGNDHFWLAPHNVYRCKGDDRWVTFAARDEAEWRALCAIMRRSDLLDDARFADMASRHANRRALDACIGKWTAERDRYWVMHRLQQAGIPAGVVMNEADVYNDVQHAARGFWQRIEHPETGVQWHVGRAWRASGTPQVLPRHAPLLGQDNEYVYRELLGFSTAEYDRFVAERHIGTAYEPSVQ